MTSINDIRDEFAELLSWNKFVTDKSGVKTLEIIGSSFNAAEDHIFGEVNWDYVRRELEWYSSTSLNVNDIPGGPPTIWKQVADKNGYINSNYGWCIFAPENGNQYMNVEDELRRNPNSRRATMIYTRPSMWKDYNRNGMSDFMCTNAVQYLIRDNVVNAVVQMRSNDVTTGFRNDLAWQREVLKNLAERLDAGIGQIFWNAGSLHIYEKDFYLVDHYIRTGETTIAKKEYRTLYPDSKFC